MKDLFNQYQASVNNAQSQSVQVFNCELGEVRVIIENGEPLFCASDVCKALEHSNGAVLVNRLFDTPSLTKCYIGVETGKKADGTPAIQNRETTFLTESQLYKLIMRSNAKNAEKFQDWVCNEVLPSIRKTGQYQIDMSNPKVLLNQVIELAQKQLVLLEENEALKLENKQKQGKIDNYESVEKARRSKQELVTKFNKTIRLLAEQKFDKNYPKAYNFVYEEFTKLHCISDKINLDYLKQNIDYLCECLNIATMELK